MSVVCPVCEALGDPGGHVGALHPCYEVEKWKNVKKCILKRQICQNWLGAATEMDISKNSFKEGETNIIGGLKIKVFREKKRNTRNENCRWKRRRINDIIGTVWNDVWSRGMLTQKETLYNFWVLWIVEKWPFTYNKLLLEEMLEL